MSTSKMSDQNPQAEQMAHESMVRNLRVQAQAIWPQERPIFSSYGLAPGARVLDVGCGTGEVLLRLASAHPEVEFTGVDVHEPHLELARKNASEFGERVRFQKGDAFALDFPDNSFDLALCRHMLQAVPEPERVLAEMKRVTRPGGRLHLVTEDYGMIHCEPCAVDADRFWRKGPIATGGRMGTELMSGRKAYRWLQGLGLVDIRVEYLVIDTVRVERSLLVELFEAWRDGYTDFIAANSELPLEEVRTAFEAIIASFRDPACYGLWMLPLWQARVPE